MKKLLASFLKGYVGFFVVAVAVTVLFFSLNLPFLPATSWSGHDSEWYIKIAEGKIGEVMHPFSSRFLYPLIAGVLDVYVFHDITAAFFVLAAFSLVLFFVMNAVVLKKALQWPILLIPLFALPYFSEMLREFFVLDIFYLFLTALFFLLLFYDREKLSLVVLFLLFLTRESTILLALVLIIAGIFRSKKLFSAATAVVTMLSLYVINIVGAVGTPNMHNLSPVVHTFFKLPYNFLANALGIRLWVNGYHFCAPVFTVPLPSFSFLGNMREIGFCNFDISFPIGTTIILLTVFGILPLLLFSIFWKKRTRILQQIPFWLLIALGYGVLHYFIGVPAGTGVLRIVGYGWPAFLLAVPFLMRRFFAIDGVSVFRLSLIQLFVAWFPLFIFGSSNYMGSSGSALWSLVLILLVVLAAYGYALRILRNVSIVDQGSAV